MTAHMRAVFDCNIYFQALISPTGPSGQCVKSALAGQIALICSATTIEEIRETANRPLVRARVARITDASIALLVENIERVATFVHNVPERFVYPRDPDDAHYANLALAADARFVVSRDNDLLDLMDMTRPEGREFRQRFPSLEITEPVSFRREIRPA